MTLANACMLVATFLPYLWVVLAKTRRDYSNRTPRDYLERLEGWRRRANWAQMNAWEAFAPFAAAVLLAEHRGAPQSSVDTLAGVFVLARILHGVLYILDQSTLRSIAWTVGFGCVVGLYVVAASV